MKTFEYKGYTVSGSARKGLVEAMHPKAARERLSRDGILVERLVVSGTRAKRISSEMRGVLYRELSALLAAGIPLVSALDTLIKTPEMRGVEGILGTVRDHVREGASLAQALSDSRAELSRFEVATIGVAERAAALESVLVQLADFIDEHERMREQISHAMIYPAIVLGLGVVVAIVMLGFLVPRTQLLMGGLSASMPLLTRIMLAIGNGLWPWGLLALGGVVLLLFGWLHHLRSRPELRIRLDRRIFRLWLVGRGYALVVAIRFSRTLAILVRAGIPLVEGVSHAGRSTGSLWVESLADVEAEGLRHGATLADTLRRITPLADLLPGWVEVGEASGSLADLLDRAAERCQAHWDRFLARSLALLEPVLLLVVGGFVLLITLAVMLPMFSLSSAIAR
ncbi:MAG: type II secretion system F family protein [Verrucomicrobia bacterium]|jgi:general secretion pathway protein F|nr:type II secretion system F family protein [Verrucomicrobiota bacterium]